MKQIYIHYVLETDNYTTLPRRIVMEVKPKSLGNKGYDNQ